MKPERCLIIIPIAHTPADIGSLGNKISPGETYEASVTQYQVKVFRYLRDLPVDFSRLRIYQDGLPDTSSEVVDKIIAETQTANYEILRWIREKGASILGTEDPQLLMEAYRSLQANVDSRNEGLKSAAHLEYMKKSACLLEERDEYIAERIKATLPEGEIGLLFIGAAHNIGPLLEKELQVVEPVEIRHALPEVLQSSYGFGKERK